MKKGIMFLLIGMMLFGCCSCGSSSSSSSSSLNSYQIDIIAAESKAKEAVEKAVMAKHKVDDESYIKVSNRLRGDKGNYKFEGTYSLRDIRRDTRGKFEVIVDSNGRVTDLFLY